ncbi:glycoside hydrolase family 92 [Colletotrichum plurivorum]|uniref:Glycoside hydrolase family 92 n=1 Tax=Colletotrichum plurivorum TaxID=2175906 RepID=A0A8H6NDH1_9PEZI|nr:glycoside hydrolase family 92 [Colletotrichum plurivorum]
MSPGFPVSISAMITASGSHLPKILGATFSPGRNLPRARLSASLSALSVAGLLALPCLATVADIPSAFGPVYPLVPSSPAGDISQYLKRRPSDFVHPGIWHTHEDLERMRSGVLDGKEPWKSTYDVFSKDSFSQASYQMKGPYPVISRGSVSNHSSFVSDSRAAWQNAIMWYITRDDAHWNRSTAILDGWGSALVDIIGTDRSLLIGLDGDLFVNAAEIMRWEGNWTETGAKWQGGSGFSIQLYWLFSRQSVAVGQANYGMASIKALLSFAVYLDDVTLYNYAINEYLNNPCAGLYSMFEPETGQSSESGRDQSHAMSGIGWTAMAARVAQSQGSDLFSQGDDLILKGAEYSAKFNLNQTVKYDPKWFRCEAVLVNGPWAEISQDKRGVTASNPMWDIIYYEYVVKRKRDAPWTTKAKETVGPERRLITNDHPSWGGLIWGL